jgi:hypothetical protein
MIFLILDIFPDIINDIFAHRHDEIVILPSEFFFGQAVFVDPKRRFAFYQLHYFLDCLIRTQRNQTMSVFPPAVDEINKNPFFFGVFPNMLKNLLPDVIAQKRLSVFR